MVRFFDQLRNINMKFHCNICEKTVARNCYATSCDICNMFLAIIYLDIITGNFRKTVHLEIARTV